MLINMCRICARRNLCEQSINLFEHANRKVVRHIFMIAGVRLRDLSNVPAFICHCCQSDLKLAMTFRKLCLKTQKRWQPKIVVHEDSSLSETECQATAETLKITRQNSGIVSKFSETDDGAQEPEEPFIIMLEEQPTSSLFVCEQIDEDEPEEICSEEEQSTADPILTTNPKNNHKVTKQEDEPYICEQCGKHSHSKTVFERHMRKHTGERPYGCLECTAKFLTAAELRSHHRVHTGERPFACRYCERRYVSYMGRLKHERIHTNERPFVCAECGKTFTNSYILKNHMLVHTGERQFRCDLCERSFQRKTHLRTHFQSNTHKQNVMKQQQGGVM
ncbi:transcription factor Ouib [Drosophila pseudoobscura]|uniref:Transcription factor Ouib n=1 Tax=Drosophila pseudoobscura pseudoobscura TaxID=46245 RepID=A0A6I8URL8_DROPS|nr:transcription factor Ouib [Drosophila pseudoobscura]